MWRCLLTGWMLWGQDTLYLTLKDAEKQLLQKNLLLIAQQLQIESDRALVWQARLWPNPQLSLTEMDVFTQAEAPLPPFLAYPRINQVVASFSQVILTARKRLKGIALAEAVVASQEAAFAELLRQLRYALHTAFYGLQRDRILLDILRQQASPLRQLADRYRTLSAQGLVPLAEYLRLENLYFQIQSELHAARQRWEEGQHTLRTLLRSEPLTAIFWVDTVGFFQLPGSLPPNLDTLLVGVQWRGDVRLAAAERHLQEANLAVVRAAAYPDLLVGANFDRLGGYRLNQWGLGVSLTLPLFNRNQGRVQAVRYALEAAQARYEQALRQAQSEVLQAWRQLQALYNQAREMPPDLLSQYQRAENTYRENLLAGRIGFLTYVDFFQSYRELAKNLVQTFYLMRQTENELRHAAGL
ncbi:MAG: TolC family protein [Bacteroidia bacterium]|nr:TolC family protein [Bacteroidia bacterium]MDW8088722.1 TolC family protein [Bacteroidia bacterium]